MIIFSYKNFATCFPYALMFENLILCVLHFLLDVRDYWPDLNGDLTKVTWSHATNSQAKLAEALSGTIVCVEMKIPTCKTQSGLSIITTLLFLE